jgi:DNA mismatch repair protein MutS2
MALNLLDGNTEALELLDWPQLMAHLSILSHFELTKEKLNSPFLDVSLTELNEIINQLEIYLLNFDEFSLTFNSKVRLINDSENNFRAINDCQKGKFFEASELHFLASLCESYTDNHSTYKDLKILNCLSVPNEKLSKIKKMFSSPLRDFVDFNGNVSYERHPVLKKLNAEVLQLESDLRTIIHKISKTEMYSSKLQMDNYDIINDRYVLALRSDSYNAELGPIIARSQSGMTLFVEPYDVRDKGNKRIHLLSEIESTILKLTIELSKIAHNFSSEFEIFSQWVLELDWLNTKATYSLKTNLNKPKFNSDFNFSIDGLFHPLLKSPIRNNILLKSTQKGMIISGPNTGGKTVILKSIAITILFSRMGLYVPAQSADIHPINNLFYFSHDHQNLSEGLSSFASEAKYYLELLSSIGNDNLIIIDEIFNSTSSEEASALAISFLEEIHLRSHSKIVLSTHHQVLKTFMHADSSYVSAHVGYDFESNRPTYKLITGEPGSSLAFKIFENLSAKYEFDNDIGKKAKSLLDHKQVTYENLLQELSQKKVDLDKLYISNRNLNTELKNQKSAMEGTLYLEREKILNDYTKKIKDLFRQAENIVEEAKAGKIANKRSLSQDIHSIQSNLFKEAPQKKNVSDPLEIYAHLKTIQFEEIAINSYLFSLTLKKNVKVQNINPRKKEVQVQHGVLSVWLPYETLRYSSGSKPFVPQVKIHVQKTIKGDIEIDCRGMRLEEFQKSCMLSIDEVVTGEIPFVTIIHGHGEGILKSWLRGFLKKEHPDLRWENIEGNDGCTKIYF